MLAATCNFTLRFPSGCWPAATPAWRRTARSEHSLAGADCWAELSPAFGYSSLKLHSNKLMEGHDVLMEPTIAAKDQFALEMDHMALYVMKNLQPHTPGEEGLQDMRLIEAIYESARMGRPVKVPPPHGPMRGPEPEGA